MFIRKATEQDLYDFVNHISQDDVNEMAALNPHLKVIDVLLKSYSDDTSVIVDEEGFIFGIGCAEDNYIWLLTTSLLTDCSLKTKKQFIEVTRRYLDEQLNHYSFLYNYIWSESHLHKHFLKMLGATFHDGEGFHSEYTGARFERFSFEIGGKPCVGQQ